MMGLQHYHFTLTMAQSETHHQDIIGQTERHHQESIKNGQCPRNLSISLRGEKESNGDSPSTGEGKGKAARAESRPAFAAANCS